MISLQNSDLSLSPRAIFGVFLAIKLWFYALTKDFHLLFIRLKDQIIKRHLQFRADLHLFLKHFVIGWENNRDGDITMPLSLKTIGSAVYRYQ